MSALAVYRDLLLTLGLEQAATAPAWKVAVQRLPSNAPPAGAVLRRAVRQELFGWLDPEAILLDLADKFPRAHARRLNLLQLAAGVALHVEGLRTAEALGLQPRLVHTLVQLFDTGIADRVSLHHVGLATVTRAKVRGRLRPSDSRIPLPNGWHALRRTGRPVPWEPLPAGWQMSGHGRWLWRRPDPFSFDPLETHIPPEDGGGEQ